MSRSFSLFRRFGVEIEYMLVDRDTLRVLPWVDWLTEKVAGSVDAEVVHGPIAWSNELVSHVLELKCARPEPSLSGLAERFQREVRWVNQRLARLGAKLLPTGMHPLMNPRRDARIWPHQGKEIYRAFDRIFGCRGHGFSNLQSVHLNLPFRNDDEFFRLHTAIRLILPLLPGLAASSPFVEGRRAPQLDRRLEVYRTNCARVPSVTGAVVPEPVRSRAEYERRILNRIYRDLAPHDPDGLLAYEWVNARGAIARFDRNTIEIRVLDVQECPRMDFAILELLVAVLRALTSGRLSPTETQIKPSTPALYRVLSDVTREAGGALVRSRPLLRALGLDGRRPPAAREVWASLIEELIPRSAPFRPELQILTRDGSLSERLRRTLPGRPTRPKLRALYHRLARCLDRGEPFEG